MVVNLLILRSCQFDQLSIRFDQNQNEQFLCFAYSRTRIVGLMFWHRLAEQYEANWKTNFNFFSFCSTPPPSCFFSIKRTFDTKNFRPNFPIRIIAVLFQSFWSKSDFFQKRFFYCFGNDWKPLLITQSNRIDEIVAKFFGAKVFQIKCVKLLFNNLFTIEYYVHLFPVHV